jgi:hypothetical protein
MSNQFIALNETKCYSGVLEESPVCQKKDPSSSLLQTRHLDAAGLQPETTQVIAIIIRMITLFYSLNHTVRINIKEKVIKRNEKKRIRQTAREGSLTEETMRLARCLDW